MPTKRERDAYDQGYKEGYLVGYSTAWDAGKSGQQIQKRVRERLGNPHPKKKRKLSAWNKFVKANSKKPRFIYRNGKLNLKKMGVAFRKTPAGKKKKR